MANDSVVNGSARPEMALRIGLVLSTNITDVFRNDASSINKIPANALGQLQNRFRRSFLGQPRRVTDQHGLVGDGARPHRQADSSVRPQDRRIEHTDLDLHAVMKLPDIRFKSSIITGKPVSEEESIQLVETPTSSEGQEFPAQTQQRNPA